MIVGPLSFQGSYHVDHVAQIMDRMDRVLPLKKRSCLVSWLFHNGSNMFQNEMINAIDPMSTLDVHGTHYVFWTPNAHIVSTEK